MVNMFSFSLALFAIASVAESANVQVVDFQNCSTDSTYVTFQNITISNAALGQKAEVVVQGHLSTALDSNPTLETSLTTSYGLPLPCVSAILQCHSELCGGTTQQELELNQPWNNTCPITPGNYTMHLTVNLQGNVLTRLAFGNGSIIATVRVQDDGKTVGCVKFPVDIYMSP
uniref:MD-2-related lipid-recognition domain-containing protein n=1 Tax=Amblyomma maculatum TaxID=34609 RepID=G3MQH3_AMBMU